MAANAPHDVGSMLITRDSILLRRYEVTADSCIERSKAERNMDTRRHGAAVMTLTSVARGCQLLHKHRCAVQTWSLHQSAIPREPWHEQSRICAKAFTEYAGVWGLAPAKGRRCV